MLHINHFSEILRSELDHHKNINESYSLRAFASKIGVAPSKLSEILNRKQGLSEKSAIKICKALKFSEEETEHFLNTVKANCSRSAKVRVEYQKVLENQKRSLRSRSVQESLFSIISSWYHFAILELINTKDFESNLEWISKRLAISIQEAREAVGNLKNLDLIAFEGDNIVSSGINLQTTDGIGSSSIKKFNDQVITKAKKSIYEQETENRHLSTLTVGINKEILPEVYTEISKFRKELNDFIMSHPANEKSESVYCFSSQFFELTQGVENE